MPNEIKAVLKEKTQLTPDTWGLKFDMQGSPFEFQMGQFVILKILLQEKNGFILLNNKKPLQYRSYSITSPITKDDSIELIIKKTADGFVSHYFADNLDIGDEIEVMGPYGQFILPEKPFHDSHIFIAAGSGIAPYLCMMRSICTLKLPIKLHLIFSNKTESDIIAKKEIENACINNPLLSYDFTLTRPESLWSGHTGRINT